MLNFDGVHELLHSLGEELERIEGEYWLGYKGRVLEVAERYGIAADTDDLDDSDLIRELLLNADGSEVDDDVLAERLRGIYYTVDEWNAMEEEWNAKVRGVISDNEKGDSPESNGEQNNMESERKGNREDFQFFRDNLDNLWERTK